MADIGEINLIQQKETISESQLCNEEDEFDRIESDGISSHPKCRGCKKRLKKCVRDRSRNCSLCGDLFCYQCTVYRRKLSQKLEFSTTKVTKTVGVECSIRLVPDDVFGTLHSVCCNCFTESETDVCTGAFRDLIGDFECFRQRKFEAEDAKAKEGSLCCSMYTYSTFKRRAVVKEIDRLTQGFVESSGLAKELFAEVIVPKWQKSAKWIDSSDVSHCYHCEKPFKLSSKKINCRVGGQVFCSQCSKDEMLIYLEETDGEPKWGINGKVGPTRTDLVRYEMYKICTICSDTLHTIFHENVAIESWLQTNSSMESISKLQRNIKALQNKVDKWLPDYIQAVEALDGSDVSKMSCSDKKKLAKLHFDLIYTQSLIKERRYEFQKLQPQTSSQKIILKNVQRGVQNTYEEHKCLMECTCKLLSGDVIDELRKVQKSTSRKSMEQVSADVYQMAADVAEHTVHLNLDDSIVDEAEMILLAINEEFLKGYPWKENYEAMMKIRRITFQIESSSQMSQEKVQHTIAGHCSTIAHKCCLQLEANTLEQEFKLTKHSLKNAWIKFEFMFSESHQ